METTSKDLLINQLVHEQSTRQENSEIQQKRTLYSNEEPVTAQSRFKAAASIHKNRLNQLKEEVKKEQESQKRALAKQDVEVINYSDFEAMGVVVTGAYKKGIRQQVKDTYDVLTAELKQEYSKTEVVSKEVWLDRQKIKYKAYKELFEKYVEVADKEKDLAILNGYQIVLSRFAAKFEIDENDQSVYERVEADDYVTKGIASVDALLVRKYNEGDNKQNLPLIYNLINRSAQEKLLIYGLLENGISENVDFLTVVKFTSTGYVPDAAKIMDALTPNAFLRTFGKNFYTKKIMKALKICDAQKEVIGFAEAVKDSVVDADMEMQEDLSEEIAQKNTDAIVSERSKCLFKCMDYMQEAKSLASIKTKDKTRKKQIERRKEEIAELIRTNVIRMVELDNMLPENDAEKVGVDEKNAKHPEITEEEKKAIKKGKIKALAAGAAKTGLKSGNIINNIAKAPINVIGAMGGAINMVKNDLSAGVSRKWHLPADVITHLKQTGRGDDLTRIANLASTLKPVLTGMNILGSVFSSILLGCSVVTMFQTFGKMTYADRAMGIVEIGSSAIGLANGLNASCKGLAIGSQAAETIVGGSLTLAVGVVNAGLGTYQLIENHDIRGVKREAAAQGLKQQTRTLRENYLNQIENTKEEEREEKKKELNQKYKDNIQFNRSMLKLSERMSDRRQSAAINKITGGVLSIGAGIMALISGPVIGALLGAAALGVGMYGIYSSIKAKRQARSDVLDEYFGVNKVIESNPQLKRLSPTDPVIVKFKEDYRREKIQSEGYSNEKAYFSNIMLGYANILREKLYDPESTDEEKKVYEDLARSMGIKVNRKKDYPTAAMIHSKLMS